MTFRSIKSAAAMAVCALCIISSTIVCGAVSENYTIPELDEMIITLPDGMTAVTRSSESSDKYFSVFGLDYDTTMQTFKNGDIYLQGMDSSSALTITVTMTKTDDSEGIKNYNLLENEKLGEVMNNFLAQNEYIACTPDQSEKIVWLEFNTNVTAAGSSIKAYQANTVYDGMSINVTLQRNGGDVTSADYEIFSSIVSSVVFNKEGTVSDLIPFIVAGAAVVAIILIVFFIIIIKRAKKRGKRNRNNRIIEELADKYNLNESKQKTDSSYTDKAVDEFIDISDVIDAGETGVSDSNTEDDVYVGDSFRQYFDDYDSDDVKIYSNRENVKVVSDDEVDEILSSTRSIESDKNKVVYLDRDTVQEYTPHAEKIIGDEYGFEDISSISEKTDDSSGIISDNGNRSDQEIYDSTEDDDFNNDEELVRQQAKRTKFRDSDDFFEEAPKKTMGVISNKEIHDAEDYDVINEIERRATEVETEDVDAGVPFTETLKKIGNGIKSFGVHCGYFCKNVYRMIKRKRAAAKRKKAEEERRERARMRAERERQRRRASQNGELVQVHSRNERKTPQGTYSSQQRHPSSGAQSRNRRPSGSRQNSTSRRPGGTSGTANNKR